MLRSEHLDVRTVTMGISLFDCAAPDFDTFAYKVRSKILRNAEKLVETCDIVGDRYGIPVVNKRISVSPMATVCAGFTRDQMVEACRVLDDCAKDVGVDFIGGFGALVEKGMTPGERNLIDALPEALATTDRICSSINVGSTKAGINMDAVKLMGERILDVAAATADRDAIGCAKATRQLLSLPQRPTAILFPDDFSAIGGVQAIREEGLLIPRDISVAGYDGNLISQVMSPQLTTYRQDTEAMGKAAAELLIEEIESPRTALPEQRLIAGSFARGESIGTPHR